MERKNDPTLWAARSSSRPNSRRSRWPVTAVAVASAAATVLVLCQGPPTTDAFGIGCIPHHRAVVSSSSSSSPSSRSSPPPPRQRAGAVVPLRGFLDGIFGGGDGNGNNNVVDKIDGAVLATYDTKIKPDDADDIDTRFESLSEYVTKKWIRLFEVGTIKLTTPVQTLPGTYDPGLDDEEEDDKAFVDDASGCRLVFRKVDTGYGDDDDDKNDDDDEREKENDDEPRQGGVEIVVQKRSKESLLRVVARRCEIDEGTLIKEMSEEIILKELAKAVDVWKKEKTP